MEVKPEIDPMTKRELLHKYFSLLGKKGITKRHAGLSKEEISKMCSEKSKKGWETRRNKLKRYA